MTRNIDQSICKSDAVFARQNLRIHAFKDCNTIHRTVEHPVRITDQLKQRACCRHESSFFEKAFFEKKQKKTSRVAKCEALDRHRNLLSSLHQFFTCLLQHLSLTYLILPLPYSLASLPPHPLL